MPDTNPPDLQLHDIVDVTDVTGKPMRGEIVGEFMLSAERADFLKRIYPDLEENDKVFKVALGKDQAAKTCSLLPRQMTFVLRPRTAG